jgi:hypothetical protein
VNVTPSLESVASERAVEVLHRLRVRGTRADHERLARRLEVLLWHFLSLRWYDAHRFFECVESQEAKDLLPGGFRNGVVYRFFSERQDDREFENAVMIGLSLWFAAARRLKDGGGADPFRANPFAIQRQMELAVEEVEDIHDLLRIGKPPS